MDGARPEDFQFATQATPQLDPANGDMLPITPEQAKTVNAANDLGTAINRKTMTLNRRHFGVLLGVMIAVMIGLSASLVFLLARGRLAQEAGAEVAQEEGSSETMELAESVPSNSEPVVQELSIDHALVQGIYGDRKSVV